MPHEPISTDDPESSWIALSVHCPVTYRTILHKPDDSNPRPDICDHRPTVHMRPGSNASIN